MAIFKLWKSYKYLSAAFVGTLVASIGTSYVWDVNEVQAAQHITGNGVEISQMYDSVFILSASVFKDVRADHWASDAIRQAHADGIVMGYTDGTFKPSGTLTEAEFATIIQRLYQSSMSKADYKLELKNNHWADGVYAQMAEYGVALKGYVNMTERDKPVSRGTVAQVIAHLRGEGSDLVSSVDWMFQTGLTSGKTSTGSNMHRYGANDNLTRAEIVVFAQRVDKMGYGKVEGISHISLEEAGRLINSTRNTQPTQSTKPEVVETNDKITIPSRQQVYNSVKDKFSQNGYFLSSGGISSENNIMNFVNKARTKRILYKEEKNAIVLYIYPANESKAIELAIDILKLSGLTITSEVQSIIDQGGFLRTTNYSFASSSPDGELKIVLAK